VRWFYRLITQPLLDYMDALQACLTGARVYAILIAAAFVVSWWVYVPIHELAHAWGCLLAGGEVTRLEIDWVYGAPLLARVFPYVAVGSAYAGQLTGFDTHGDDLIYLVTDALPFVLTILLGVPLLRALRVRRYHAPWRCALLGFALPVAFAPFASITGDYYEMGSILVTRVVRVIDPQFPIARWRSDDLFLLIERLWAVPGPHGADAVGLAVSFCIGLLLAFLTYWLGTLVADLFSRRAPHSS
jgi:hypothetical protein